MKINNLSEHNCIINRYLAEMRDCDYQKNRLLFRNNIKRIGEYEASYSEDNHVHQVCTICGKVTEIVAPQVTAALKYDKRSGYSNAVQLY